MDEAERKIRDQISYDIRSDLVCCDIYDKIQEVAKEFEAKGLLLLEPEKHVPAYHDICHWGEAAARIAEGTSHHDY